MKSIACSIIRSVLLAGTDPLTRAAIGVTLAILAMAFDPARAQQDETNVKSSSEAVIAESHARRGLPDAFALAYELDADSISPDGRFGVIVPNAKSGFENAEIARDFLVALKPFQILAGNKGSYYRGANGMAVDWTRDSSAALVTLAGRWGTISATLFELRDGRVTRCTNLLAEVDKQVAPRFPKGKVQPYSGNQLFSPETTDSWSFSDNGKQVLIELDGNTAPNSAPGLQWQVSFKGTWSVPEARWIEKKITSKAYRNAE